MKTILILLFTTATFAQSYVELRGGSIIREFGGQIGVGYTVERNNMRVTALFNAFSIDDASMDRYDIEVGYSLGDRLFKVTPIIGVGYVNHRLWRDMEDKITPVYGISMSMDMRDITFVFGYRDNVDVNYIYTGVKLRFRLVKNRSNRFF